MAGRTSFEQSVTAVFRLLLHLYPAEFRDEYRRELTLVFVDRFRAETSLMARLFVSLRACVAVLFEAPREHCHVLIQDLRLARRMARRDALFTTTAVGTIAVGIALTTSVFTVGKSLLIDTLPYRDADRIAMVWINNPKQGFERDFTSYPRLVDWREQSRLIESFAGFTVRQVVVTDIGDAEQLRVAQVTPEFFDVVGTTPVVGRLWDHGEQQRATIVLSHGLWQRKFGGDPAVVGRPVRIDSRPYIVVGVLPRTFRFPDRNVEAWVPLNPTPQDRAARSPFWLRCVARLRAGVSIDQAGQEMHEIAGRLAAQHATDRDLDVVLVSLRDEMAGPFRPALYVLLAAVVGVLLIACVNVAGMLTARGAARRGEIAIRTALGAGRRRVIRQLTTEAVVLFAAGGVLGIALGWMALRALVGMAPPTLGWLRDVSLDRAMLAAMFGIAVVTGVVFGVMPSWRSTGADAIEVLGSGSRGIGPRGISQRFRQALVVVQVSTATIVLVSTCLLIRSLILVQGVELGFEPTRVLTAPLELSRTRYSEPAARQQFVERLMEQLRGLPGVAGVAGGSSVLLGRLPNSSNFTIEGRETIREPLTFDVVTPEFFRVLQIPLLRGRYFSSNDRADGAPVAILNETTAKKYWPNSDPVGKRFKFGSLDGGSPWLTIVGVVADTRRGGVDYPVFTESYQPFTQEPRSITLLVRTTGEPSAVAPMVRATVREIDKDQPLGRVAALHELVGEQTASRRFNTWLLTVFAAAAAGLTGIGLYGLVAYLVLLRRHEMAVRLAIGATRRNVLSLVVRDVSLVVGIGLALGLAGALATSEWMRALLFEIQPTDGMSLVATVVLLAGVGIVAAWAPARRAMRVDPCVTLRTT